jgi:hypothetical protein
VTRVVGLQVLGRRITRGRITLGWGTLSIGRRSRERRPADQGGGYVTSVVGLEITLTRAHGGLPAGSRIDVAFAFARSAPEAGPLETGPLPADRPQLLPPTTGALLGVPQVIEPGLTAGPYVFPVYGQTSLDDDFGFSVANGSYDHGLEIVGQLGEPLVAVANGTLFAVGWSRTGGNRLWLRDRGGNEFYYGGLSAFSSLASEGAHVRAGEVVGFMGDSGSAEGDPTRLAFEIHPESLLYLGRQGAVDPASYLSSWPHVAQIDVAAGPGWAPSVPGTMHAPDPGAILVSSSDISSAGVGAATLRRRLGLSGHG